MESLRRLGGGSPLGGSPRGQLGPEPLVRHGDNGQLQLQSEGLSILHRATSPVHIVFAVGGSRCGKSTASNALTFGGECAESTVTQRFVTGDTFEPVTTGVDIAVRPLATGGSLVVADCEGAFHICGSAQSARGFGALGLLAYHMSSVVLHVSMGSIDERDIEVLGFLAASADCASSAKLSQDDNDKIVNDVPHADISPPVTLPALFLLVNGARFELGDAVARRLLKPPDGSDTEDVSGRWSARHAIARGFRGQPALEALPNCEHAAYWPKVDALRNRLMESQPLKLQNGLQSNGHDVAARLQTIINALNGETPATAALREPAPAIDVLYRSARLEPLVEEISKSFAAAGAAGETTSDGSSPSAEDALADFDRRALLLLGDGDGGAGAHQSLLVDMRARLAARFSGISEALARGRQHQHAAVQRSRPPLRRLSHPPKDMSSEPGTPCGKKSIGGLESSLDDAEKELGRCCQVAEQEILDIQERFHEFEHMRSVALQSVAHVEAQADQDAARFQDRWSDKLRESTNERNKSSSVQSRTSQERLWQLQVEVQGLEELLPDTGHYATQLQEVRDELEAGRLRRQEAGNKSSQSLDNQIQQLRRSLDSDGGTLSGFREAFSRRLTENSEDLSAFLKEEQNQRRDRYCALAEVVERLKGSLEATVEPADSSRSPSHSKALMNASISNLASKRPSYNFKPPSGVTSGATNGLSSKLIKSNLGVRPTLRPNDGDGDGDGRMQADELPLSSRSEATVAVLNSGYPLNKARPMPRVLLSGASRLSP